MDKNKETIHLWQKLNLTVKEAAEYSGIGENKIYELLNSPNCTFVLYVGEKKKLIKRKQFEDFISKSTIL